DTCLEGQVHDAERGRLVAPDLVHEGILVGFAERHGAEAERRHRQRGLHVAVCEAVCLRHRVAPPLAGRRELGIRSAPMTSDEYSRGAHAPRFRRLAAVGHGGMADIYLTVARGVGGALKLLMLKDLRPALARDPEYRAMFQREAKI